MTTLSTVLWDPMQDEAELVVGYSQAGPCMPNPAKEHAMSPSIVCPVLEPVFFEPGLGGNRAMKQASLAPMVAQTQTLTSWKARVSRMRQPWIISSSR
jgi:hypothetical protein